MPYSISIDAMDLRYLPVTNYSKKKKKTKLFDISSAKMHDYVEFEIFASKISDENSTATIPSHCTTICQICNMTVPACYVIAHNQSIKHKMYKAITENALERLKKYLNEDNSVSDTKRLPDSYFCDVCCLAVLESEKEIHERSQNHCKAFKKEKQIRDFLHLYSVSLYAAEHEEDLFDNDNGKSISNNVDADKERPEGKFVFNFDDSEVKKDKNENETIVGPEVGKEIAFKFNDSEVKNYQNENKKKVESEVKKGIASKFNESEVKKDKIETKIIVQPEVEEEIAFKNELKVKKDINENKTTVEREVEKKIALKFNDSEVKRDKYEKNTIAHVEVEKQIFFKFNDSEVKNYQNENKKTVESEVKKGIASKFNESEVKKDKIETKIIVQPEVEKEIAFKNELKVKKDINENKTTVEREVEKKVALKFNDSEVKRDKNENNTIAHVEVEKQIFFKIKDSEVKKDKNKIKSIVKTKYEKKYSQRSPLKANRRLDSNGNPKSKTTEERANDKVMTYFKPKVEKVVEPITPEAVSVQASNTLGEGVVEITFSDGTIVNVFEYQYNGFISVTEDITICLLCNKLVKDTIAHMETNKNHLRIRKVPIRDTNCIRQIGDNFNHCILCNNIFVDVNAHLDSNKLHLSRKALAIGEPRRETNSSVENMMNAENGKIVSEPEDHLPDYYHLELNEFNLTCKVCNLPVLNFLPAARHHINTKQHVDKYEEILKSNGLGKSNDYDFFCEHCNIDRISKRTELHHIASVSHYFKIELRTIFKDCFPPKKDLTCSVSSDTNSTDFVLPKNDRSKLSSDIPKLSADIPKLSADIPKLLADIPKLLADTPQLLADVPKLTSDIPKLTADIPKLTADTPKLLADTSKLSAGTSKLSADIPKLLADTPKLTADIPKLSADIPKLSADDIPKDIVADPNPKLSAHELPDGIYKTSILTVVNCMICEVNLPNSCWNVDQHIKSDKHKIKYEGFMYYHNKDHYMDGKLCKLCNVTVDEKGIAEHFINSTHEYNLKKSKLNENAWIGGTIDEKILQCEICNSSFSNRIDCIHEHVTGDTHRTKWSKYLKNNKLLKYNNDFYCEVCKITVAIPRLRNHSSSFAHKKSIANEALKYVKDDVLQCYCLFCGVDVPNHKRDLEEHKKDNLHIANLKDYDIF